MVKVNLDRFIALFVIHAIMGLMGLCVLFFTGLPSSTAIPYAVVSGILHTGYNLFLARAYRHGEMSLVYPLARGAAPVFALIFSLLAGGDRFSLVELAPLSVLIGGLWMVALGRDRAVSVDVKSIVFAFATAGFIGLYTVVDGLGARLSENALAFIGLIYFFDGLFIAVVGLAVRGTGLLPAARPFLKTGSLGAVFAATAYGLVVWAMTHAPIAVVAALRETSILFVLGMATYMLKETLTWMRLTGGVLIVVGAAALRFV
jgi:drug/metabolite transporter (DMT)-like permease